MTFITWQWAALAWRSWLSWHKCWWGPRLPQTPMSTWIRNASAVHDIVNPSAFASFSAFNPSELHLHHPFPHPPRSLLSVGKSIIMQHSALPSAKFMSRSLRYNFFLADLKSLPLGEGVVCEKFMRFYFALPHPTILILIFGSVGLFFWTSRAGEREENIPRHMNIKMFVNYVTDEWEPLNLLLWLFFLFPQT